MTICDRCKVRLTYRAEALQLEVPEMVQVVSGRTEQQVHVYELCRDCFNRAVNTMSFACREFVAEGKAAQS